MKKTSSKKTKLPKKAKSSAAIATTSPASSSKRKKIRSSSSTPKSVKSKKSNPTNESSSAKKKQKKSKKKKEKTSKKKSVASSKPKSKRPKAKTKNNTKHNLFSSDEAKIPFNVQPNIHPSDRNKRTSIKQKHGALVKMGMSPSLASNILKKEKNQGKSARLLMKLYGDESLGSGRKSGMRTKQRYKRKIPKLPPIENFLPMYQPMELNKGQQKRNQDFTIYNYHNTPWCTSNSDEDSSSSSSLPLSAKHNSDNSETKSNIVPEQYQSIPQNIKNKLNDELESFYNFVRLTDDETDARNYIVECITNETNSLFASKCLKMSRNGKRAQLESRVKGDSDDDGGENENGGFVQLFGSFATPEVSTFWSDVDLAIWGIIGDDNVNNDNNNFLKEIVGWDGNDDSDNDDNGKGNNDNANNSDDDGSNDSDVSGQGDNIIRMTTSSVARTMELLHNNSNNKNGDGMSKKERVGRWKSALGVMSDDDDDTDNKVYLKESEQDKDGEEEKKKVEEEESDTSKKEKVDSNSDMLSSDGSHKKTGQAIPRDTLDVNTITKEKTEFTFIIDREGTKELGGEDDNGNDVEVDETDQVNHGSVAKTTTNQEVIVINDTDESDSNSKSDFEGNENNDGVAQVNHTSIAKVDTTNGKKIIVIDGTDESDNNSKSDFEGNDNDDDDDDDDDLDLMDSYYNRARPNQTTSQQYGKRNAKDLCSSSSIKSNGSDDPYEELKEFAKQYEVRESSDGLEINVNTNSIDHGAVARNKNNAVIGPQGNTRKLVIKALKLLSGKLHKSTYARSVETRTNARVPIICVTTCLGFDGDIAIGGHNGTDTSHYVRKQVERYNTFAAVTLLLKVLLHQTDLDKPFSGGLGSYKLYVMIAHHYKTHLSLGGGFSAAEIIMTFLYRYSNLDAEEGLNCQTKTEISKPTMVKCDGGEADLNAGIKAARCADLFGVCYERIMHSLEQHQHGYDVSMIASIIKSKNLKFARKNRMKMASEWKKIKQLNEGTYSTARATRSVAKNNFGFTFTKSLPFNESNQSTAPKRGPRGGLIPKRRPDIDAKPKGLTALLLRGSKKRKNKRKQNRDSAFQDRDLVFV